MTRHSECGMPNESQELEKEGKTGEARLHPHRPHLRTFCHFSFATHVMYAIQLLILSNHTALSNTYHVSQTLVPRHIYRSCKGKRRHKTAFLPDCLLIPSHIYYILLSGVSNNYPITSFIGQVYNVCMHADLYSRLACRETRRNVTVTQTWHKHNKRFFSSLPSQQCYYRLL